MGRDTSPLSFDPQLIRQQLERLFRYSVVMRSGPCQCGHQGIVESEADIVWRQRPSASHSSANLMSSLIEPVTDRFNALANCTLLARGMR